MIEQQDAIILALKNPNQADGLPHSTTPPCCLSRHHEELVPNTRVLAGGGVHGGQIYGSSDRQGEYPAEQPATPADVTKTVYSARGSKDMIAYDSQIRPCHLLDNSEAIHELLS